jgi:hypothetical protein
MSRGARAHRDVRLPIACLARQRFVGLLDLPHHLGRQRRLAHRLARRRAGDAQRVDLARIETGQRLPQRPPHSATVEHRAVGVGGERETVRHADTERGELADHLSEGSAPCSG